MTLGRLDALPRTRLSQVPTPLEPMPNLAQALGAHSLWVKRDDATGLAFGGNKTRQLEFYLGEALSQHADTILITGAVQSNFVRQAAAAACKLGLVCHVLLEERVPETATSYRASGNVLLDKIFGAHLHAYPTGEDERGADVRLTQIASTIEAGGGRPYVIPLGPGHKPLGALGYVLAAKELLTQITDQSIALDEIILPSGSGSTHSGLLFGLRALGCTVPVTGICVRRAATAQRERVWAQCTEIAALLEVGPVVDHADIVLDDDALAPGYGRLNEATLEALRLAARYEGLLLDPVYTGKAMAGLVRRAERQAGRALMFIHTGGTPALFAYEPALTEAFGD